LSRTQEEQKEG